jgi:Tfp pilus assembly protein PilN
VSNTSGATAVAARVMPSVNLMPPEIAEAARFRRFQLAMGGAVVAAIVIVGALYVHQHSSVKGAQSQLDAARSQQTSLQSQLTSLSGVQDVYTDVAARQALLAQAMGAQVKWSDYLTDLSLRVPDNVWLTSISATETAGPTTGTVAAAPATTSPLLNPGIGQITFNGMALHPDDVATWLDMLARERGFSNAYFTNSAETGLKSVVAFASQVNVTPAAESNRFVRPAGS